jgi:nitrogen fixation/metabolism regulation signal transduction histidine kinase
VIIPTIPLTFFTANLITQSADVLLLPGIGEALKTSIETIRMQTEERGKVFLNKHSEPAKWTSSLLEKENIHFLGHYQLTGDSLTFNRILRHPESPIPKNWMPNIESVTDIASRSQTSTLIYSEGKRVIIVYHPLNESTFTIASYTPAGYITKTFDDIDDALSIYNTLSMIKESILKRNIIWGVAVVFIISMSVLAVAVAKKLSRGISEPIQNLVHGINQVAEGNLSIQVETRAKGEFRSLVESFNKMTGDLKTNRQKLKQAERIAAWQDVARQISHEIKNSLTPISLSLGRVRGYFQGKPLPAPISESIQAVEDELGSMKAMAAEFSEFARMPQPKKSKLNLNNLIKTIVILTGPSFRRLKIETALSPDINQIDADKDQIKRMLTNLIKNAAEASQENGTIHISTRASEIADRQIEIEIQDHGEGMDQKTIEQIFHPYYTTKKKGTGLGLTIVRKILDDHNGEIYVESQKGKGTDIIIYL